MFEFDRELISGMLLFDRSGVFDDEVTKKNGCENGVNSLVLKTFDWSSLLILRLLSGCNRVNWFDYNVGEYYSFYLSDWFYFYDNERNLAFANYWLLYCWVICDKEDYDELEDYDWKDLKVLNCSVYSDN